MMKKNRLFWCFTAVAANTVFHYSTTTIAGAAAAIAVSSFSSSSSSSSDPTIFDVLFASSNHAKLSELLDVIGLSFYLSNATQLSTLFAPTDDAIAILQPPYSYYFNESDLQWYLHLFALLSYHIVPQQELDTTEIFSVDQLPTLAQGVYIPVNRFQKTLDNGATIINADITASNGYIQVPDRVLLPDVLHRTITELFFLESNVNNNNTSSNSSNSINNNTNNNNTNSLLTSFVSSNYTIFKQIFELAQTQVDVRGTFLSSTSSSTGFTLFAPPDFAFASVERSTIDLLLNRSTLAVVFILNHITNFNVYTIPTPTAPLTFYMANGVSAWFSADGGDGEGVDQCRVNTANITQSLLVGNGVINVINQVLLPPLIGYLLSITTAVDAFQFTTFLDLVQGPAANLTNLFYSTSPLTLFAPLDSAFASNSSSSSSSSSSSLLNVSFVLSRFKQPVWSRHLQNWIMHHFAQGSLDSTTFPANAATTLTMLSRFNTTVQRDLDDGNVTIDHTARAVISDLKAFNGIIYGIDQVLLPRSVTDSIFHQLVGMDGFSTLLTLLRASTTTTTNLTQLLSDTNGGPLTLLAPDDTAFALVGNLSDYYDSTLTIQTILMGHLFEGNIFVDEIPNSIISQKWNVTQIGGSNSSNSNSNSNNISVGGGSIITQDILASNGVIHVINRVLMSPSITHSPTSTPVAPPTPAPVFVSAPTPTPPSTLSPPPVTFPSVSTKTSTSSASNNGGRGSRGGTSKHFARMLGMSVVVLWAASWLFDCVIIIIILM